MILLAEAPTKITDMFTVKKGKKKKKRICVMSNGIKREIRERSDSSE